MSQFFDAQIQHLISNKSTNKNISFSMMDSIINGFKKEGYDEAASLEKASELVFNSQLESYELIKQKPILEQAIEINRSFDSKVKIFTDQEIGSLMIMAADDLFYSLENEEGKGCYIKYEVWSKVLMFEFRKSMNTVSNFMKRNQAKANSRFLEAKTLSRAFAKSTWSENQTIRYGQIANDIREVIKNNPMEVGLKSTPALKTIKDCIRDLAPNDECLRSGRPPK